MAPGRKRPWPDSHRSSNIQPDKTGRSGTPEASSHHPTEYHQWGLNMIEPSIHIEEFVWSPMFCGILWPAIVVSPFEVGIHPRKSH